MATEMNISDKPFACTNEGCDMSFTNEDHLMVHKKKHDMNLNLGLGTKSNVFAADQTPTPTRFLRNCEEVGLFQDLQNVNPFEETFRRATEQVKSGNIPIPDIQMNADDTLHTPHVFPTIVNDNFISKNDSLMSKSNINDYELKTPVILKIEQKESIDTDESEDKNDVQNCMSDDKIGDNSQLESGNSMLNTILNSSKHFMADHNYNMVGTSIRTASEKSNRKKDDKNPKFAGINDLMLSLNNEHIKVKPKKASVQSYTKEKIKAALLKNKGKPNKSLNVTSNNQANIMPTSIVHNITPQPIALASFIQNPVILSGNCISTPFLNNGQLQTISILPSFKLPIEENVNNKVLITKSAQPVQEEIKLVKSNNYNKKVSKKSNLKIVNHENNYNKEYKNDDSNVLEEKMKKKISLERNRAAAHRARTKRKLWIDNLVDNNSTLTKANKELVTEVQKLRSEVAQLKSMLLTHKTCEVTRALNSDDSSTTVNLELKSKVLSNGNLCVANSKSIHMKQLFEGNVKSAEPDSETSYIQSKKLKPNIQPLCIPLITVTNFSNEVK